MEVWRPIPGYPSFEASSLGRIRRARAGHTPSAPVGKIVPQRPKTKGYLYVMLYEHGRRNTLRAHRLIAAAFHGECPPDLQVSHLNGVCTDNRPENLTYETATVNNRRRIEHGTMPAGDRHWTRRAEGVACH